MRIDRGHHTELDYHQRLLDDLARVDAYDRAIRALVKPGDVVLDLGAGTGLLAMLAARCGARVHAVESASVGALAERLIAHNGLSEHITLHREDAVTLEPAESVDLVIGEWMGRFVIDDQMLDAVQAAGRWLGPGGRFAPSRVHMRLGPVGDFALPMVDRWRTDLLGIDLSPALPMALNTCYAVQLGQEHLLADAHEYAILEPPARPERFEGQTRFAIERPGLLRGVAGFWEAQLAPGVALSTAPGTANHWGQYLFPLEPLPVQAGDVLEFELELDEVRDVWEWKARLSGSTSWETSLMSALDPETLPRSQGSLELDPVRGSQLSNEAMYAFASGDRLEALRLWTEAVRLMPPGHPEAPVAFENLGIGRLNTGRPLHAAQALKRAMDGGGDQAAELLALALERLKTG